MFMRTYASQATTINPFAAGWKHNYSHIMDPVSDVIVHSNSVTNTTGLKQSRTYYAAESACLNGWNDISTAAFRGQLALPSVAVQYAGGSVCKLLQNGNIVATLSVHSVLPLLPVSVQSTVLSTPPKFHSIVRGNGSQYLFQRQGTLWKDPNHPGATLVALGGNWLFTDSDRTQERYDDQGRLTQITNRQGQVTFLYHDLTSTEGGDDNGKTLDKVTGPFGRSLAFSYQTADGKLASVSTPDGPIRFNYDALGNLVQVTYPDNTTESYHYEKSAFPHHLTGITDEKDIRFATWDYDDQGRAILSEHAGHTDKVTFVYNSDGTTTVADALGAMRTYHFQWAQGGLKVKKITGDRCSTCGNGDMKERSYDANGYLSGYTDWNGIKTTYTRDATGLELNRTEATGTPDARTITTAWHTDFRRPLKITEEGRITEFSYDAQGRLLSQTIRGAKE
jgi:YD repeat-containing protein